MTFTDFCEVVWGRSLSDYEKELAALIEKHHDANIPYLIRRGSAKMFYQDKMRIMLFLYHDIVISKKSKDICERGKMMTRIDENMTQSERAELWGGLIDVVEDWLEEKGFSPKDFPNDDREGDPSEAIIFGEDYDRLANGFANVIGIARDCVEEIGSKV